MSKRITGMGEAVDRWVIEWGTRETPLLRRLREETARLAQSNMQISPDEGRFLGFLTGLIGAKRVVEVGTFTGYSSTCIASALPADGKLICCDMSEEWTSVARRYWAEAGVADKIELRLAPGVESLEKLLREGGAGSFDLIFIDADKENYGSYYELALALLRQGGVIALDNTLWDGTVADPGDTRASTEAIRNVSRKIHGDARVDMAMATICDGITLVRKL